MKQNIKDFCKKNNLTKKQFLGKENVLDNLDLRNLTSIPDGFNPTVGGYLDLENLTSIPDGFNPTVGGNLYLRNGLIVKTTKPKGLIKTSKNKLLSWKDGKYIIADNIFTEVISKKGNVYKVKKINSDKELFLVTNGTMHSHGETIAKAKEDFRFKILSEKLKKEPITEDTIITDNYYRLVTGACELGVKQWREQNKITIESITAKELVPILEKTNAYGFEKFKQLISF